MPRIMGVLSSNSRTHQGLMWAFGLLFCALLLHANTHVSAESQEDSDLVFDSLELTNLRNHRIARQSSGSYSYLESSQAIDDDEQEDHWLSRTVNRIKRSIGNIGQIFSNDEKQAHKQHHEKALPLHRGKNVHAESHVGHRPNLIRKHRQSDFEDPPLEGGPGIDDEDAGFGSGKDGSGDIDEAIPTKINVENSYAGPVHPRYYRCTISVEEYFVEDFRDRNSAKFKELASVIEKGVKDLFATRPGDQEATVISIEKDDSDPFKSRVTVDLVSMGWQDDAAIKNVIHDAIQDTHRLDYANVAPENFIFNSFDEHPPTCLENQLTCKNTQCVDGNARCNGIRECSDNSDEEGCPSPSLPQTTLPSIVTEVEQETTTPTTTISTTTATTTTTTTTTTPPIPDFGSGDGGEAGRSDDILTCKDGVGTYYGDQKCDGARDCEDGSDEEGCEGEPKCAQGEYSCDLTRCIPINSRCDGLSDCTDETDEQECTSCSADAFHCDSNKCIQKERVCDRVPDCRDGTDERHCEESQQCLPSEFSCGNGQCIPGYLKCSGNTECSNGVDEQNCPGETKRCEHYQWQCQNGQCIDQIERCNHNEDCTDGTDELNCTFCKQDSFRCHNGSCVNLSQRCDGVGDCPNSEDEEHCDVQTTVYPIPPSHECSPDQIRCRDGSCVSGKRCDRVYDCLDGTDEENCQYCSQEEFRCHDGTCIDSRLQCDGLADCLDESDEKNCGCIEGEFDCGDGTCIDVTSRCDRHYDCPNGKDEQACSESDIIRPSTCEAGEFDCGDGTCINLNNRCDRHSDCQNGRDEEGCPDADPDETSCQDDELDCGDGTCIEINRRCDGRNDCQSGKDEEACPDAEPRNTTSACGPDQFDCGGDRCISDRNRCDSYPDCPNGADELNCSCKGTEHLCPDGSCIAGEKICDGIPDCPDRSDETNCINRPVRVCSLNEFRCERDNKCIPNWELCDGMYQCSDRSDEQGCPCKKYEFQCLNGQCVDERYRCNGRADCSDYSDEQNCPSSTQIPITLPPVTASPISCPFAYVPCASDDRCILRSQLCDGRGDCPDLSDESNCRAGPQDLMLRTYPSEQVIKENQEVVFQCRDEGLIRARVQWKRANGLPLPPGSRDINGRLEIPNIKVEHSGTYVCVATDFPLGTPGAEAPVQLRVEKVPVIYIPPPVKCLINESTCSNGDCIPRQKVCDGQFDCSDGSDEIRCRQCEPNEFRCENKKCVSAVWKCDGQDDCGDGSDERYCAPPRPGEGCSTQQFTCRNDQCIPRSFHCDGSPDCIDRSDEIGCTAPVITQNPPHMVTLTVGQTFTITCRAIGIPTPQIMWRLNWHHVPAKCRMTSEDGFGTLTCEDIQVEDQGAYSCEAMSSMTTIFASPDTILTVTVGTICREGYFNVDARSENECIKCFCFGHTSNCRSADLFIFQFQPPFDALKLLGARIDPRTGVVDIRDEPIYKGLEPHLQQIGRNGVRSSLPYFAELNQPDVVPYFALPENYHGNQLKSYGGYLRYSVTHDNTGRPIEGPDVILTGNNYILLHETRTPPQPYRTTDQRVRFFDGDWIIKSHTEPQRFASREEIMMALEDVSQILIKLEYSEGLLNTTLSNIEMDSAAIPDSGLGDANYVEECSCPVGYTGSSCENCAEGYSRHNSGQWLGQCFREPKPCSPGSYFDGRECQLCPCPYTSPSNQFGRTCHLNTNGNVVCDCQSGYVGLRCEQCAPGFTGNPLQPGDVCRPSSPCDPQGSLGQDIEGRCQCKEYTTGPYCDQCKANSFFLSTRNQFGCISCFCMGVTQQCSSSSWYRDTVSSVFTSSTNDFRLTDVQKGIAVSDGIRLNQDGREILYSTFRQPEALYWSLPIKYLGDKVTSYGGYLKYTIRNTPVPGGASSRNNAPDVELISENNIDLQYFSTNVSQSTNGPQTFTVPLLEQYWQRRDGVKTDREHLLMALADVKSIYIKATYFTSTQEAALISVSLDIATDQNTGRERAYEVEQCHCPPGYTGLSCEDCAFGYTRSEDGIYLELCKPCECNGYSNECDPETGICRNCRDNTAGNQCEQCIPGFTGDPTHGQPCKDINRESCICDPRGSTYNGCVNNACQCKANVEGSSCDRCRNGTFGLSVDNIDGCEFCFCSGVSTECSESRLYVEQIPVQIIEDHGFILTDQYFKETIKSDFKTNLALNEIGYTFPPSRRERMYWSLPRIFTGNQIKSYGGKLEYMQRYIDLPYAQYVLDKDIIITGNNVIIYWTNPTELRPEIVNTISARIHPGANWYRMDQNRAPKSASREDILTVLANIDTILIRATPSTDTSSTFLSDITLDTAVDVYTAKPLAISVETCRCPPGYRGTSCESCSSGYYKDFSYSGTNPLGSCRACPCNNREESCRVDQYQNVVCDCLPGYTGRYCETLLDVQTSTRRPGETDVTPEPPTIDVVISGHNIEIYQIGSSVRLSCSAVSRKSQTPVRIDWLRDNEGLPYNAIDDGRGILYIRNLTASDSGRYICRADDGYSVVTESINIVVGGNQDVAPVISLSPPIIEISIGRLIEVRCSASGNPIPEFYLSRIDGKLLNPTHLFENGILRIPQAESADAGQYQCTAVNRVGQDSRSFEVHVTAGEVLRVDIEPSQFEGRTGDEVFLRCMAGQAQNIRWSKENGPLPYQYRDENGILIIPNAQPSDSGVYLCTATSYDGSRGTQHASVNIKGSGGIHPSARVSPGELTLRQGETTEIRCEATGAPTPSVKWSKVGGNLGGNVEQIGNSLHITNARTEDRGLYVCVVSNELGLEQAVARIDVTRYETPLVQILPEGSISVSTGNSVQLQCRPLRGYPAPTITWSRVNGLPFNPNVEVMTGGNLRIIDITPDQAGEYECSATNEAGTAKSSTFITVSNPPTLSVVPDQDIITKSANEYLKLACYGTGNPQPSVTWQKATSAIDDSTFKLSEPGTAAFLEFTRLSPGDGGIYVCRGQNEAGTTERRVQIDILPERGDNPDGSYYPGGDQGSPTNVEEFDAIAGARAEIRCRVTSIEETHHYVDWVRPNQQSLPEGAYTRQGILYIDNVQPSAAGDYECVTYQLPNRNVLFRIRSRLRVLSPPRIYLEPNRQTVEPGQNAYIRCSATGDQPIDIRWVPVNRTMPASVYTADGYIRFNNIHQTDAGKYRCVARNSAGEADSVAEVFVAYQEVYPPNYEPGSHVVTSAPGRTATLHCRPGIGTENYPVRWTKENSQLPENSRLEGQLLYIFDLTRENEGRYYCTIQTPTGTVSDYVDLQVVGPSVKSLPSPLPALHITPEETEYPVGANIDLKCQSNEPGVIPVWSKISGGLADNLQNRAGRLTIFNARTENAGAYRCEATGQKGLYYKDYNLRIKAPDDPLRDEVPLQVQRAKRGASVILECNTDLEEPVSYFWSKQGGSLPYNVDEYSKTIQLNSVGAIDAGTYICSASSQRVTLDIPIVLVVTGIIPYFPQAPNSYITLPTLGDAYLQFSFEISFKPEKDYGLIIYNGNREKERDGDFISLALNNGVPEFKFNLGPGTPTTVVKANVSVNDREWHTTKVVRNKKRVIMFVDGKGPFIGENEGKYFGLDLSEPLFLGGVPNYDNISPEVDVDSGLVGCISKFKIGYSYQDILHDSLNSTGITNCETCTENKCQNQGTCQEALTTEGYTCICPAKFSGPTCNKKKGQACSPYSCGIGKCIDTEYSFQCQCPLGRSGKHCEKTVQVYEPAFKDNAYIAYPPPRPLKRTRIEMRIKPKDANDGILLYAAETNEGHGDFISLAIKDRHLEFRFDNGKGPVVVRSDQEIVPNQWSAILAIRSAQDGRIIINGHPSTATRFTTFFKTLTLLTPLYVGGYDQYNVRLNQGVKVDKGFNGCIVDINVSGLDDAMMKNITDSSNVEDCANEDDIDNGIPTGYLETAYKPVSYDSKKTGCSDNPCKNNAPCIPLSPVDYKCTCPAAFSGKDCDVPVDLCQNRPCQNEGICKYNSTGFTCDCPLGFGGKTCDQRVELRNDAHFDGKGWLEFSKTLLPHKHENEDEVIALEISTNKSDGLIFWHGQDPNEDGQGHDYISLALVNGYLEFSYDLGSGPAIITNTQIRVDDGERHSLILKRQGKSGSIDIDHTYVEEGESEGRATSINCNGNIFLGGTPNISKMTGSRFASGFHGCIHRIELQQPKTLDLGIKAINGLNVKPCSSFSDIDNNIWNE